MPLDNLVRGKKRARNTEIFGVDGEKPWCRGYLELSAILLKVLKGIHCDNLAAFPMFPINNCVSL